MHHSQARGAKCIHRLLSFCLLCLLLNSTHCPAVDISVTVSARAESPVQLREAITQQLHAQRRLMFYSLSQYGRHTSVSLLFLLAWLRKITSEEVHKEVHYAGLCGTEPWTACLKWYWKRRDVLYYWSLVFGILINTVQQQIGYIIKNHHFFFLLGCVGCSHHWGSVIV